LVQGKIIHTLLWFCFRLYLRLFNPSCFRTNLVVFSSSSRTTGPNGVEGAHDCRRCFGRQCTRKGVVYYVVVCVFSWVLVTLSHVTFVFDS
jgi:hypothetical protein